MIFTDVSLAAGQNNLSFNVPSNLSAALTGARFRFSSVGGLNFYGYAFDGEVEDYIVEISVIEDRDWGDAPDPNYPTLSANNGAYHGIDGVTYLGNSVDAESDGQPDATATGDDLDGNNDDDGVQFSANMVPGYPAVITITASTNAILNAWIDFDNNQSWADAGEHIFQDQSVTAGTNKLQVNIPSGVATGTTVARFRLSTVSGLGFTGSATDGEVEDYQMTIKADTDGDGIPDTVEGSNDRDNDGVLNHQDYDPDGYIYDELTGQIISGGQMSVSGPTGAVITVRFDGSSGFYQFWTDGTAGTYTLGYTPPTGYQLSTSCSAQSGSLDPTGMSNPLSLGAGEDGSTGILTSYACGDNTYYWSFDLAAGDPFIINNNIPISNIIPIELSSFTAVAMDAGVKLEWSTQSETENMGFYIYRFESKDDDKLRINDAMIDGTGNSNSINTYQYIDASVKDGKTYYYQLSDLDYNGNEIFHEPIKINVSLPKRFELDQNYPNPFNPETTISYQLSHSGYCYLKIFNLQGQLVRTLVSENQESGRYSVVWDGRDDNGFTLPSGVYIYQLRHNDLVETRKMNFIK
jgi:hypothetical protein